MSIITEKESIFDNKSLYIGNRDLKYVPIAK